MASLVDGVEDSEFGRHLTAYPTAKDYIARLVVRRAETVSWPLLADFVFDGKSVHPTCRFTADDPLANQVQRAIRSYIVRYRRNSK